MRFQDIQDIDKLNECIEPVNEIFGDNEIFNENTNATFGELATPIYKKHKAACEKLFEILDEKPTNAAGILVTISGILVSIEKDREVAIFFIGVSENLRSWQYARQNTVETQQEGISNT